MPSPNPDHDVRMEHSSKDFSVIIKIKETERYWSEHNRFYQQVDLQLRNQVGTIQCSNFSCYVLTILVVQFLREVQILKYSKKIVLFSNNQKSDFKSQFSMLKITQFYLRSTFCVIDIFGQFQFLKRITYFPT